MSLFSGPAEDGEDVYKRQHQGTDSLTAERLSEGEAPQKVSLGNYTLTLTYTGRTLRLAPQNKGGIVASPPPPGSTVSAEPPEDAAAILVNTAPDEFYFTDVGGAARVDFTANTPGPGNVGLGDVEEGRFVDCLLYTSRCV